MNDIDDFVPVTLSPLHGAAVHQDGRHSWCRKPLKRHAFFVRRQASRTFVATAQASHHGNTKKFDPRMAEKKRLAEEKAAREVELMRKTITRRVHEAHMKRDQLEAQRLKEIESEQSTFVQEVDGFLR